MNCCNPCKRGQHTSCTKLVYTGEGTLEPCECDVCEQVRKDAEDDAMAIGEEEEEVDKGEEED